MTGNASQAYGQCGPVPISGDADGVPFTAVSGNWERSCLSIRPLGVLAPLVDQREPDDRW